MQRQALSAVLSAALLAFAVPGTASAQARYVDAACGTWVGDLWVSNRTCEPDIHLHQRIVGTIVSVRGHLVTVAQPGKNVTFDDTLAVKNRLTGRVAKGRRIVAHGYWDAGRFYATMIFTRAR